MITSKPLRDKYTLPSPPRGWPSPLGPAAMQGLLGDIVGTIAPNTEADPAALLLQTIVTCGNAMGRGAHFFVGETRHGTNLYTVSVGETARTRKGTSLDFVTSPLRRVDSAWAEKSVQGGLSTGEGLVALAAGGDDPGSPSRDKRLLFVEDEFSSVLRVMKRRESTLSAILRRAWDGRTLRVTTRHQPLHVAGAHVSLVGHITLQDLRSHMSTGDIYGGLFNRVLWACVRRWQFLPDGGQLPRLEVDRLVGTVRTAIEFASRDRNLKMSEKARLLWHDEYYRLTDPPRSTPLVDAVTARAEAQVRRLAAVYAVMDLSPVVRRQHVRAALEVWRFCSDSAHFIFGQATRSSLRDRILELLADSHAGLTRTDISRELNHHFASDQIAAAVKTLHKEGRAKPTTISTRGRSAERWSAIALQAR